MAAVLPPLVRSGANALNRSLFTRTFNIAAAALNDAKKISVYRQSLLKSNELLRVERLTSVVAHPDKDLAAQGRKCLLLNQAVKADEPETWGPVLKDGVEKKDLAVVPFKLELGYDFWSYQEIMRSILPEEFADDLPTGFNTTGHVAHFNIHSRHDPYKNIIAEVVLDKNHAIRTVINKTNNVGTESEFRTFQYEVLAGPEDLNVKISENNCVFEFDYSKVYWNSRLETEHTRLLKMFQPGEVVCDVMAGIGPFALPAGKKGVFVWANDMNPESYAALAFGIKKNKVSDYVRPFNQDGRTFIQEAVDSVRQAAQKGEGALVREKPPPRTNPPTQRPEPKRIPIPPTISHFVMNLPASAITFLKHYRGIYQGQEALFEPHTKTKLPMVHTHCFAIKLDDETPIVDICERITNELGFVVKPGDPENEGEVAIYDVRDVAPAKRMFCASFRLPREVAFRRERVGV